MSSVGPAPDPDIFIPAGRVELLRSEYPTVFQIVSASAFFTDQATINANPRAYAGQWEPVTVQPPSPPMTGHC